LNSVALNTLDITVIFVTSDISYILIYRMNKQQKYGKKICLCTVWYIFCWFAVSATEFMMSWLKLLVTICNWIIQF